MSEHVCGGLAPEYAFDFELVFPAKLFAKPGLRAILTEAGIERDAKANRMPVFRHFAARLAFAEACDRVKEALWNAGWAIRAEAGEDLREEEEARVLRLAERILEKVAAEREGMISRRVMLLGIQQIHGFEAERMKGRMIEPGALGDLRREVQERKQDLEPIGMWEAQALISCTDRLRGAPGEARDAAP